MSYSVIQLTLNASFMGDQWLAVRKTARRLFPGVSLEEREAPGQDRLVLDVRTVLGHRKVSASRGPVEIERFEKWLAAEAGLRASPAGADEWQPGQSAWQPSSAVALGGGLLC